MNSENNEARDSTQDSAQKETQESAASLQERELRKTMKELFRALSVDMAWRFTGLMQTKSQYAEKQSDDNTQSSPPS